MQRRSSLIFLASPMALVGWPLDAICQVARPIAGRTARIGWVTVRSGNTPGAMEAFRAGLRDRGWVEGLNLVLVQRVGERADAARVYDELRQTGVEVIVATGAFGIDTALLARDVPVIFVVGGDPVEAGLVRSMARPHANRTGMTLLSYELIGKRLELVRQVLPQAQRIGYLFYEPHPGARQELQHASEAAATLGLTLRPLPLNANSDVDTALLAIEREGIQATLAATDQLISRNAPRIAAFAAARGVPVASGWSAHVHDGFLLSYGAGVFSFYHYLASYIDRALRGVPVADMPAETPPKVELALNRRTARTLGVTLPLDLLARVDAFIDGPG